MINELHTNPDIKTELVEFIELHNAGVGEADLSGWRFTRGVDFRFPNVAIPGRGYLVVAANVAAFRAKYPTVTNVVKLMMANRRSRRGMAGSNFGRVILWPAGARQVAEHQHPGEGRRDRAQGEPLHQVEADAPAAQVQALRYAWVSGARLTARESPPSSRSLLRDGTNPLRAASVPAGNTYPSETGRGGPWSCIPHGPCP